MRRAQWQAPPTASVAQDLSPEAAAVLRELARALERTDGHSWDLTVERQRLAGRSEMFIIRGEAEGAHARWVVKQPSTGWTQDDVGSPLSAEEEFRALERLHAHFSASPTPFRVPVPVAHLPEVDAFAMEHVPGPNLKELLHYGSLIRPALLLDGITAAGSFLRELHASEALPPVVLDLEDEAQAVLSVTEDKLRPLGLDLPPRVRRTLTGLESAPVQARQVRLHGDFGPANIILAKDGSTVGVDAAFDTIGQPEDDLVRFVALVSGAIRLAPEVAIRPFARIRRELETRLLRSYYEDDTVPALFEVRYLHQLARRWCRLRELARQHERRSRIRLKFAVIDQQVRLLMLDAETRLVRSLGGLE